MVELGEEYEVFSTGGDGTLSKNELRFNEVAFGAWFAALPAWEQSRFEQWVKTSESRSRP